MVALPTHYQYRKTPITQVVPIVRLTPTFSYDQFVRRATVLFWRHACYYSLIYYTGDKRAKEPPVIGVLMTCPGSGYTSIHFDLRESGLLPCSKRWRQVRGWLESYQIAAPETPEALEEERAFLSRIPGTAHLLDLSPVQVVFDRPYTCAQHVFKEHYRMSKSVRPTVHAMVEKRVREMDREEVLFYLDLVIESVEEETRQKDALKLLGRFVTLSNDHTDEERRQAQQVMSAVELVLGY